MITLVEALRYRCLEDTACVLDRFHVLVGPNGSGKSTFLDVLAFLGDFVKDGLESAVENRAIDPRDLLFRRRGNIFQLAVEARPPDAVLTTTTVQQGYRVLRYEVSIGIEGEDPKPVVKLERLRFRASRDPEVMVDEDSLFPRELIPRDTLHTRKRGRAVFNNEPERKKLFYYSEAGASSGMGYAFPFKVDPLESALGNLPKDDENFPAALWFRSLLTTGLRQIQLNSREMRNPVSAVRGKETRTDGSNLPLVVERLANEHPAQFADWLAHIKLALPDILGVKAVEQANQSRYIVIEYPGKLEVPSWLASDGTLRLLALTILAYDPDSEGLFLIEEPENGIHPKAVEVLMQALSSVYSAQVLVATHSPMVLGATELENILCFAKRRGGSTDVVRGNDHPALREWHGSPSLELLFAGGVLG